MPKRMAGESELVAAAIAFDEQLAAYGRLAELLLKTPLASARHLERVNQTIEEVAAVEGRLSAAGQELARAIGAAHQRQQQLAEQMVAHLPEVQRRTQELRDIVDELQHFGEVTREINAAASGGAAVAEVEQRVTELAGRAEALATRARTAGFEEVASQAHALHQQMLALGRKLRTVTSRQS